MRFNGYRNSFLNVSVSTSGSKGVQLEFNAPNVHLCGRWFQYPQADRRGCNYVEKVSVIHPHLGFSIHKRIEGGATAILNQTIMNMCCFSIHKRIEGGATRRAGRGCFEIRKFQYPQADRRGCNSSVNNFSDCACQSFSIHKRIEGGATAVWNVLLVIMLRRFSIHKRIEGGATSGCQRHNRSYKECFSIHKRIEGGATYLPNFPMPTTSMFQYPQADRRGCNCWSIWGGSDISYVFQYPQADRRGCNRSYLCAIGITIVSFSIHKRIEGGATSPVP